jgi:hypothetical protein
MRHIVGQPNNGLNIKRQTRYLRDLQPFVGKETLAYRKGAMKEAYPSSRRQDFVPYATTPLFWDGDTPSYVDLRRKSQPLFDNA